MPFRPPPLVHNRLLHVALVHHPTVDKLGHAAATAITNLDVHDLSRAGRTYDCAGVWIVHPAPAMHRFVHTVMDHWIEGWGLTHNPTRGEALATTAVASDLGEVAARIAELHEGRDPVFVASSAKPYPNNISYATMRGWLLDPENRTPYCLLFGTGWGLHPCVMEEMDYILEPIWGPTDWNHLSVRSAAGIIMDRLMGR